MGITLSSSSLICIRNWLGLYSHRKPAQHVASIFFDHWIVTYGITAFIIADNDLQLESKLLGTLCRALGVKNIRLLRIIQELMAIQNAKTRPLLHSCVMSLPNSNVIGIYSCNHSRTHTMPIYDAQNERPHLPWLSPINLLHLPISLHRRHCRLPLNPKHHQRRSSSAFYPVYPIWGTMLTSECELLSSATSSNKTPKCGNWRLSALVNSLLLMARSCRHLPQIHLPLKHTPDYFYATWITIAPSLLIPYRNNQT